jgi:lysophospholipid acyltransferase (LPLAT)-like uncharacterized protein
VAHKPVVEGYETRAARYPDGHWLNPVWDVVTAGIKRILRFPWYHFAARPHPETAALLRSGKPIIFTCTHQVLLDCFNGLPKVLQHRYPRKLCAMTSKSRDGQIAADLANALGFDVARGSSARGGSEALLRMRLWVKNGYSALFAADGPKAPLGDIKPGVVLLSRGTGVPIVPIHAWGSARLRARRSWTRMAWSIPFVPVGIWMGKPIHVGEDDEMRAREVNYLRHGFAPTACRCPTCNARLRHG